MQKENQQLLRIQNLESLRQFPKHVFSCGGPDHDELGCLYLTFDDVFPFFVRRINARRAGCGQALAWSANRYEHAKWLQHLGQLFLLALKTQQQVNRIKSTECLLLS